MKIQDLDVAVIAFHMQGCGHCAEFLPRLRIQAVQHADVPTILIDVDRNDQAARVYKIDGTPTTILIRKGQAIAKIDGAGTDADIMDLYRRATS